MTHKYIVSFWAVNKYFIEYMKTFVEYNLTSDLESLPEINELLVMQNAHWIPDSVLRKTHKLKIVNTEQLCFPDVENRVLGEIKTISGRVGYCVEVVDYSKSNIDILSKHGILCTLHEYNSPPAEISFLKGLVSQSEKRYDIGFVGYVNARRKFVLDKLNEKGYKILITQTFGDERDRLIAQCKVLLNIHCEAHFDIFESIRCNRWLAADMHVVSEASRDYPDSEFLKLMPYDELCALESIF
jgi:hypothetical protein